MPLFQRKTKTPLGIYIHIPFCKAKCQYCDFYSVTSKEDGLMERYMQAICTHIEETAPQAPGYQVDTIYFGGGTPSYFGAEGLTTILNTIRKHFDVAPRAEITFEANPDSINDALLRQLRREGFNRVSLGIQCDDDKILHMLGRVHTYQQAVDAVYAIRRRGFRNLSVDLMFGLPGQILPNWEKTLKNVLSLAPEHISCYALKVEEGTPLYESKDFFNLADEDAQADMYLRCVEILKEHGYRQYEISNFCRKGAVSRHNLKYWQGGEYLGFGPNASSDFGGQRFTFVRDLRGYIAGIKENGQILREVEDVPFRERAGEYIMMGLRTVYGLDPKEYEKKYMLPFGPLEEKLEVFRSRKLAVRTFDGRWHLTGEGFLLSNDIITDLLLIQDKCKPIAKRKK
jgi:oxygen-independent coproporphyrinogen-3 oxidase